MNTRKGFTLVELLVVIAILAILATVSVVGYTSFIERADKSAAETEIHQVETSVNASLMMREPIEIGVVKGTETKVYVGYVGTTITAYTIVTTGEGETATTTNTPITTDTEITLTGDFAGLLDAEGSTLKINAATLTFTYKTNKAVACTFKA